MKRTYNPSVLVKKKRHGFLKRQQTKPGKIILLNRLKKGRKYLSK